MRVLLAYPPDFNPPTMVFAALPLLASCLKRAGHESMVIDVNAEAFTHMLLPDNLDRYFAVMDQIMADYEKKQRTPEESAQYDVFKRLQVFDRATMRTARQCAEDMRNPERFYDPAAYRHMDRVLRLTHSFLNSFTPWLDPRNKNFSTRLYEHLAQEPMDPYLEFYNANLLDRIAAFDPDIVALSCPFSPQITTGMNLARYIRRRLPRVKFVMGGTGPTDAVQVLLTDKRYYDFIDYGIAGDGEEALNELIEAVQGKRPFEDVSGLWRREGDEVVEPGVHRMIDMDTSPTPDFRGVDFSHYMLPEPACIYTTSRGCYYGKCTFCPDSFRKGFRKRSPQRVYEDVRDLVLNQGVRNLHFFDPLTPPVTLEYMSRQVAKEKLPLNWYAEVKFETIYTNKDYVRKLAQGGCKLLQFGFESGVQRVLDRMHKGNRLDQIEIILENLKANRIGVATTWFIGFPTESEEDARETWRYLRRHNSEIHLSLYTGTFGLGPDVEVFQRPEDYDVRIVFDDDGNLAYVRNDGQDWNHKPLHEMFHARSDLQAVINGSGLLYAAHRHEHLYRMRATSGMGPTTMDEPPLRDRVCKVSPENNWVRIPDGPNGATWLILVAQSGDRFELDAEDVKLLERIGRSGVSLARLIDDPTSPKGVLDRLARFVNRGYVESTDPILADALESVSAPVGSVA